MAQNLRRQQISVSRSTSPNADRKIRLKKEHSKDTVNDRSGDLIVNDKS